MITRFKIDIIKDRLLDNLQKMFKIILVDGNIIEIDHNWDKVVLLRRLKMICDCSVIML